MTRAPVHHYLFGARTVASDTPLAALPRAGGDDPAAIRVRVLPARDQLPDPGQWLHQWREDDGTSNLALTSAEHGYLLRFFGLCDFHIDAQLGDVVVEPLAGVSHETIEHLLIDQVLPRVLAHQGALVAHASVVRLATPSATDRTVLFLGRSGWGKSTLAGLLQQRGHVPLSDDCALLEVDAAGVRATPTYPSLRLYADSIGHAFGPAPATAPVADYTSKRRVMLAHDPAGLPQGAEAAGTPHGQRIHAVYLIQDPNARHPQAQGTQAGDTHVERTQVESTRDDSTASTGVSIKPMALATGCIALIEHSFRLDVTERTASAAQFRQCAAVLRAVPAFSLQYPRDFSRSGELTAAIEAHVAGLGTTMEPMP
jgi:hypothetical protein